MKIRPLLSLGLLALTGWTSAHAATVVNWDGGVGGQAYQTSAPISAGFTGTPAGADINYGGGAATDRQAIRVYSSSSALSPTTAAGTGSYPNSVDPTLYSSVFYGAYESIVMDATSGTATNSAAVRTGTSGSGPEGSYIRTSYLRAAASDYVGTSVLGFKKSDFLGGLNTGSILLQSISMTLVTPPSGASSNMRGRWLVQNGSTIYVSQTTFSLNAGTQSTSDFTTSLWSVYTPSTAAGTALNFQPTVFNLVDFNDVQMVGYYAETWDGTDQILTGNAAIQAGYNISDFSVVAVPEPHALALLALSTVGFFIVRRRLGRKLLQ